MPSLTALCVCYELGEWRTDAFVDHLFEWLPEFALSWTERQRFTDATATGLLRKAAKVVYDTPKYQKRGEFGELILHAAVRQVFGSEPAISKIFFKDAKNDTVKGFDSVHIVDTPDGLELWLGEAKFYERFDLAASAVAKELAEHLDKDYLRSEFMLIENKIDYSWPHAGELKELIAQNKTLDAIFKTVTIPVLLTYNSPTIAANDEHDVAYALAFETEVRKKLSDFQAHTLPTNVKIRLILLPMLNKEELLTRLHQKLELWQQI